ncbi:MAG: ferrochelatase [Candidatus Rhabdochlamydia sp.]
MSIKTPIILANFGGPRDLHEVESFLIELLTDEDVIRTNLPTCIDKWLFHYIAKRRAKKVTHDYAAIGGKSPIFEDTEKLSHLLAQKTGREVIPFHRYIPLTHPEFLQKILKIKANSFTILPLYPQQSYSTTGSIARFFAKHLPPSLVQNFKWISSYKNHESYIKAMQTVIQESLEKSGLKEEDTFLLFSAHGLPQKFIREGDPYEKECYASYQAVMKGFIAPSLLAFQSKFGRGKWLFPYTSQLCEKPHAWNKRKPHVLMIPLSFTSDHLETLFEIEQGYIPLLQKNGVKAYRCPSLNHHELWVKALSDIAQEKTVCSNESLIRKKSNYF